MTTKTQKGCKSTTRKNKWTAETNTCKTITNTQKETQDRLLREAKQLQRDTQSGK